MPSMKFEDILKDIRNKVYYPVYFLMGEESFYIDVISDFLEEKVLNDTEKEFNLTHLYGKETDIPTIISYAKRYPMMANHHLVIVREAQNIRDIENIITYVQSPLKSTILVFCYKYKSLDKRKKFFKEAEKAGVVFEGKKLYENQVPGWISDYVSRKGYRIGPKAVQMLADHLGTDLGKIVNEIGKLFINLEKGSEITTKIIEENIGISKDFNVFEFQSALGGKNGHKAFQIARYFADNPKSNPLVMVLGVLYQYFSKILIYHTLKTTNKNEIASALSVNPFFVDEYRKAAANYPPARLFRIFSYLREYDLKSKGVDNYSTTEGELLKELTYKILH
jgi:DNA polymerase III subunit delta